MEIVVPVVALLVEALAERDAAGEGAGGEVAVIAQRGEQPARPASLQRVATHVHAIVPRVDLDLAEEVAVEPADEGIAEIGRADPGFYVDVEQLDEPPGCCAT